MTDPPVIHPLAVADHFATRLPPTSAIPVAHGHIHDTFIVTCGERADGVERIVLQRLNRRVFRELDVLAENRARVTAHLLHRAAERGVRAPVADPIATRDGEPVHVDADGESWRADHFLEGTRVLDHDATLDELRDAAHAFAALTRDLDDLPPPPLVDTIPHFHDFARRRAQLAEALTADRAGRASAAAESIDQANRLADRLEPELTAAAADRLPMRIVHNDAKLDNVLVDTRTAAVAAIVDLDTLMRGTVLNDFGELARTASSPTAEDEPDEARVEIDPARFRALAEGYLAGGRSFLGGPERECLALAAPLLTLENAVRFLTDHLDGDRYYRVDAPGHNATRARSQLRLAELMLDHLPDLRASVETAAASEWS
jgi:aminoglycoside phosphotransferase (APT) family kinase protein